MASVRGFFGGLWRALDGLRRVLHLVLLLFVFALVIAALRPPTPTVPVQAALVVAPQGRLVEQLSGSPWDRALGRATGSDETETLVRDLVESIRAAAKDTRIRALVLLPQDLAGGGLTKLNAVARAVDEFRASGKPVYAWGQYLGQPQYYLLAQADEAWLEPVGALGIDGFSVYLNYFRDLFERLGVEVHVFGAGTHKTAPEPLVRRDMSPQEREQSLGFLQPLWQQYQAGVEKPRQLEPGTLVRYVEESLPALRAAGGDQARVAVERGLVTGLKTWSEFEQHVAEVAGADEDTGGFHAIDHARYLAAVRPRLERDRPRTGPKVTVVPAVGDIRGGSQPPGTIGGDSLAALLRAVRLDDDTRAVVLRIDSGGGSMLASEEIRQEVAALRDAGKPVIASFSSIAASGGYYIAMDADEIWAEPTTITGSIGVYMAVPSFGGTLGKLGVGSDGVGTTSYAGTLRLDRPLDPRVRELLQLGVAHAYRDFVARVAAARERPFEQIDEVAQGRVWIGADAHARGLVDRLGDVEEAVKSAAARAGLAEGEYRVDWREQERGWAETLALRMQVRLLQVGGRSDCCRSVRRGSGRVLGYVERQLRLIGRFDDPRGLYFRCHCEIG